MEKQNESLQELRRQRAFLESMNACINDEEHYQILMRHLAEVDAQIEAKALENMDQAICPVSFTADFLREQLDMVVCHGVSGWEVLTERDDELSFGGDEELIALTRAKLEAHARRIQPGVLPITDSEHTSPGSNNLAPFTHTHYLKGGASRPWE